MELIDMFEYLQITHIGRAREQGIPRELVLKFEYDVYDDFIETYGDNDNTFRYFINNLAALILDFNLGIVTRTKVEEIYNDTL